MLDCYNCTAKSFCIDACQPGSIICTLNRLRTRKTKAETAKPMERTSFCGYCGKPLRIIGVERFCNNVQCLNRYEPT